MVSPSGRMPKWAPDWFFVAIEACGGGTPDLGLFLGFLVFIGIIGVENMSGGPTRQPQGRGARPRGGGRPPPLWWPRDSSGPTLVLRGLFLVHKKSP